MGKSILIIALPIALLFSSCAQRIGDLTIMSNRNVEFEKKQVELKRSVFGNSIRPIILGFNIGFPSIENALDDAIKRQGTGEYLKNATIMYYHRNYILFGTNVFRVTGDLMGYEDQKESVKVKAIKK